MIQRSVASWISAKDRVRISQNWTRGHYNETQLLVQDIRYMPRLQLDSETIWVSWGSQVWAHPRRADGTVCRTASQVLRGHSDDVSRFVVKDGLIVSGGRDKTLVGWTLGANRNSYEFAFARRYCNTLFEIFIFCPKIQLLFLVKIVDFLGENVVILDFLAVDNFDFTRKLSKKIG